MLEILDFRRGIVLCGAKTDADQPCSYRTADLRLCFRIGKKWVFERLNFAIDYVGKCYSDVILFSHPDTKYYTR